jgi:DtxR family Mn-dependent transcriptional regulator
VSLSKLNTGQSFTVSRIPEELEFSPGMLEFLENTNLMPGMSGQVSATDDKGDMTLSVEGHDIVVEKFATERILVTV